MKKTVKKISCAALCAVILFCMTVPAFALTGSENYSFIDYGDGVRVTCVSTLTISNGKSQLTLGFVQNVSHLPVSDYSGIAEVTIKLDGASDAYAYVANPGLTATAEAPTSGFAAVESIHNYYVFSTNNLVYTKTFH